MNGKTYMLYPGLTKDGNNEYTGLTQVSDISKAPTVLLSAESLTEEPWYTCFPQRLQAIEQTAVETKEVMVQFGIYELRIRDGHKRLRMR